MIHFLLLLIYLAFISLGLPDALLGAAWPIMSGEFRVPVSYMGIVSLLISGFTVVSSLLTDRTVNRFGTGKVTAVSVALTAVGLLGFAFSGNFWMLCVWAIPYGLGAGCVDAGLNNYVANHYASRHMSWLHCMWGVGAAIGPYVMGTVLTAGQSWNAGYLYIAIFQVALTAVMLLSIPKWKTVAGEKTEEHTHLTFRQILELPGVRSVVLIFLCYGAVESIAGHWASSYLVLHLGVGEERAAGLAAMFYLGITLGRAVSGFVTLRFNDKQMAYMGMTMVLTGLVMMLLFRLEILCIIGFVTMGVGCAPIFPCLIHATPIQFGASRSQAIIGVEMASFYAGTCFLPPAFGLFADLAGIGSMPFVLLAFLMGMLLLHFRFYRLSGAENNSCK
ncbi:MAG: MFS transporter [Oscillospiraceae bacterium]|nr:MFS transporter [Oscillospiraceae bacterium]MBQ8881468.1 MFS transporter [Oscillospiraceae bacterium]